MAGAWGDLAGADCHAVVVGTGRQGGADGCGSGAGAGSGAGPAARLADLPSAARSARELARVLRDHCGMAGRVTELIDPEGPTQVLAAVRAAVDRAQGGAVLFCFVGHGLLGPGRQLYLATAATATADDTVTAVPYAEIRHLLGDAAARTVVVLDCCFSGRAQAARSEIPRDPYASARPDGSFLLASATHYAASFAPVGQEHTLFSGELIRVLTAGDPGGPRWLTLLDLYRILDRRFQGGPARPFADGVGRAADLVVTRNPGYADPAPDDPAPPDDPDAPAAPVDTGPCPYPGMRPFLPEQRHLFFGREELTRSLLDRVWSERGSGPVVLVGASGAGKSSLLRAGLVAGLEERDTGRVLLVPGPGARPFRALVEQWAAAVHRPFAEVERELGAGRFDGEGRPDVLIVDQLEEIFTACTDTEERELFVRALAGADPATGPRIVLGLRADFYGPCLREPRLARIVRTGQFTVTAMTDDELRTAIERPAAHAGLRLETGLAEHMLRELRQETAGEGGAAALPFLAHVLQQTWTRRRGTLLTFTGYEASGGIRRSVARVADALHDALEPAGRDRLRALLLRMVTLVDADGSAARRRLPVPALIPPSAQAQAQAPTLSPDLRAAATPAPDAAPSPSPSPAPTSPHLTDRDLLELLVAARLVVLDRGEAQLCHDSLLHGWPRLRDWIREDRLRLLLQRRVGDAADTWHEAGRPDSGLYRGDQLAAARALLAGEAIGGGAGLRTVEQDFLRASGRAETAARRVRTVVTALVAVLAVLAGTFAVAARSSQRDAEARETVLIANRLAAQADTMRPHDPQTALRLSLAAYRTAQTGETRSSLYAAYTTRAQVDLPGDVRRAVVALAYRADGKVLATSQAGGRIQLWDVTRPNVPRSGAVLSDVRDSAPIAFHPRDPLLATLTQGELALWNTADPAKPRRVGRLTLSRGAARALAFSPDGRTLAGGSADGRLRLWDVSDPTAPRELVDRQVAATDLVAVSFSHDGRFLATGNGISGSGDGDNGGGGDGSSADRPARAASARGGTPAQVRIWDVRTLTAPALRSTATATSVMAVAFHPARPLLVATGGGNAMAWWRVGADGRLDRIKGSDTFDDTWSYGDGLPSLSFRPDGELLAAADSSASGGGGRTRAVGGGADPELLASTAERGLVPGGEPVRAVAYSPDGGYLAVGDVGGNVRLWPGEAPALGLPGTVESPPPGTRAVSRDGRYVVTGEDRPDSGATGRVSRVWDLKPADTGKGTAPRLRFTAPAGWEAKAFLPGRDRPLLLGHRWRGGQDHAFRMWDLGGAGPPVPGPEIPVRGQDVETAFSPDGTLLAVAASPGDRAELWDVRDPRRPLRRGTVTAAPAALSATMLFVGPRVLATTEALDPDGAHDDLRLWDLTDPARPVRLDRPLRDAAAGSAAYLPASGSLITDHVGDRADVWDLTDPRRPRIARTLAAAPGGYTPVTDGHGGTLLATALADGTVRLLDPRTGKPVHTMRFDRRITSVESHGGGAGERARVLTASPLRMWDVAQDGRWVTPAVVTLTTAKRVTLPANSPFLLMEPDRDNARGTSYTYLLDRDTDAVHRRMCATHPLAVDPDQWRSLFPDLAPRPSC
ncbi:hypothetical protein [Streptomyces sp. NPDC090025]|uniref:caspase, EACC1-associated type n=1 Tax=Streptomyces sp. NPDC090025 TaxID=3365922 RepID=UPI003836E1A2